MVTMGGELALLGGEPEVTRPIPLWPAVGHPSHLEGGRADRTGNGSDCPTTRRLPPRLDRPSAISTLEDVPTTAPRCAGQNARPGSVGG